MNAQLSTPPAQNWKQRLGAPLARAWDRLRRSGRLEIALLLALLLAVAGCWVFASLASEVMEGETDKFDNRILLALRQPGHPDLPIGPDWTLQVARDLTALGSVSGLGIVTCIVGGYLWLQRRYSLLTFVLASVVSGTVLGLFLKEAINRPRPTSVSHLTDISTASFPSGHSMLSSVVYLTLAALLGRAVPDWRTKIYFLAVAVALILLIGFSRVYLGVHYPTDVLAGWCIGCAWAILCCLAAHFLAQRRAPSLAEAGPK
jgi:undecaprenyl-diphosphatase